MARIDVYYFHTVLDLSIRVYLENTFSSAILDIEHLNTVISSYFVGHLFWGIVFVDCTTIPNVNKYDIQY